MRSQVEIKEKIMKLAEEINGNQKHPLVYQYKILIYKLYWEDAKQFLKVEDQTEERKEQWKKLSSLDSKILNEEISEQLDIAAMHVKNQAGLEACLCCLILLSQFWLLGSKKDKVLQIFWEMFMQQKVMQQVYEPIFIGMCNELQISWDRLKLRYTGKDESSILGIDGSPLMKEKTEDAK